ncbi:hypothetical protein BT96DRAFT_986620 [Gymnopus androsaceus JB14]|uniref:F-box domain-containing protein n=1 Tax=Gymnopus androsaceus JB14 TaxID=1447944 RepID=A0A6A4IDG4_9AGAR|nr:hypothetical protein BT96DRAFT_986620 [Gymnopus androsaceus JB14]
MTVPSSDVVFDLDERLQIQSCGVLDLPAEILATIFSIVHSLALSSPATQFTTSDTVIALSQVNSFWRETCLSFPALWTYIHIICDSIDEAKRAQIFLERSGTLPLTIDIRAEIGLVVAPMRQETIHMIQKLFAECERWKEASFSIHSRSLEHIAWVFRDEPRERFRFSMLEKLLFSRTIERRYGTGRLFQIFQSQCTPRLHTLAIAPGYHVSLPFAFGQITSLTLCEIKSSTMIPSNFSTLCHQLEKLQITRTAGGHEQMQTSTTAHVLTRLKSLTVRGSGSGRLWGLLTLPSLQNLELATIESTFPLEHEAVLNMLRRSDCGHSIRRMSLVGVDVKDAHVESMLDLVPSLQELVLHETVSTQKKVLTKRFLAALKAPTSPSKPGNNPTESPLTETPNGSPSQIHLIPRLTHIELHIYYFPDFRLDILSEILLSRITTGTTRIQAYSTLFSPFPNHSLPSSFLPSSSHSSASSRSLALDSVCPTRHAVGIATIARQVEGSQETNLELERERNISEPTSGPLKHVRLCFILPKDSPQGQVPFELAKMVNRLRLFSTAEILGEVKCQGGGWGRRC